MGLDMVLGGIGLVVALAALATALPPCLQMLCGGPAIEIEFIESSEPHGRLLLCHVISKPIKNGLLRAMGVKRATVDVFARFEIWSHATGQLVAGDYRPRLSDISSRMQSLSLLLREPLGLLFCIVEQTNLSGPTAKNEVPGELRTTTLEPGNYWADVAVAYGNNAGFVRKSFRIAEIKDESGWTEQAMPDQA
jgi:hypothetical protein